MIKKRYALISIYNKEKIELLCEVFKKYNISIIATDSTKTFIKKLGYKCFSIKNFTKFKEILDGRVKTLHPKLHASLLYLRNKSQHVKEFNNLNFPSIDFVIVNLYPFEKELKKNQDSKMLTEMIDIGGATMLRSSAKNFESITTISNIIDYKYLINNLKKNNGKTSLQFRKKMASKVFKLTSNYDSLIFRWLSNDKLNDLTINNHSKLHLRYGENPHQKAIYLKKNNTSTIDENIVKEGKRLGYNNFLDINAAIECINEFSEPTCAIIKHNNPCGVASNNKIINAFERALAADPISAFGGIVVLNKNVNTILAKKLNSGFFEIIIAPTFNKESIKILSKKKKLILVETKKIKKDKDSEIKKIVGGYLLQKKNLIKFSKKHLKLVSENKAPKKLVDDLIFGFKICKHVKSNAIVLVKNQTVIGIGAGQMSRIDATKIALKKINLNQKKLGFVAASDAFFPFIDNIKLLISNNCSAVIQPSGSINDSKIIKFANIKNFPLYFARYRFFKH